MPTSLDGFKRHPKFVLERHLGAYLCFVYGVRGKEWIMDDGGRRAGISSAQSSRIMNACMTLIHTGRWDVVYPRKVVGMFKGG